MDVPISCPLGRERRVRPTAPLTTLVHHTFVRYQILGVGRTKAATTLFAKALPPVVVSLQVTTHAHLRTVSPLGTLAS